MCREAGYDRGMRLKKLNLNWPGAKIAGVAGVFGILVPAALAGLARLLSAFGLRVDVIYGLMTLSCLAGALLGGGLLVLVAVELAQDYWLDMAYRRDRHKKVKLPGGFYECQYCGNQKVRESDRRCPICGRPLS